MKVTRNIFIVLFPVIVCATSHAQSNIDFGIKAGATISRIEVTDEIPFNIGGGLFYPDYDVYDGNATNPAISLFLNFLKSEHFNLQTSLAYLRKGSAHASDFDAIIFDDTTGAYHTVTFTGTTEIGLQYLELGLLAQPKVPLGDVVIYAQVGPTISYLLSASGIPSTGNQLSSWQAGYTLGLGADLETPLGSSVFVEARYCADFKYFYHSSAKFWNRSWVISVGTTI